MNFVCWDQSGVEVSYDVDSASEAAREYTEDSDYEDPEKTWWNVVYVRHPDMEVERIKIEVEPEEPACSGDEHAWDEVSVRGNGAGVRVTDRCAHCGLVKVTDTWATDMQDGEQGLTSIEYRRDEDE